MISTPPVWNSIGSKMRQGFFEDYPDFETGFSEIVASLREEQKTELCDFLRFVTSTAHSENELMDVWNRAGTDVYIVADSALAFFEQLKGLAGC